MIRIGVCDDSSQDRRQIAELVRRWGRESRREIELRGYESGEKFLEHRDTDLLFLDIEMKQIDGITVKNWLQKEQMETRIIFITSHQEMMEEAFGKQVFGFLTKPVDYEKLREKLEAVLDDMEEEYRVIIRGADGERCVHADQILYIEANGKYCDIRLENQTVLFSDKSIGKWEEELADRGFFRCHKSYMIRLYHVRKIESEVLLSDGERIPLSRRIKNELKTAYREYLRTRVRLG